MATVDMPLVKLRALLEDAHQHRRAAMQETPDGREFVSPKAVHSGPLFHEAVGLWTGMGRGGCDFSEDLPNLRAFEFCISKVSNLKLLP